MNKEQLDFIIKQRSDLMHLIESLMHDESIAFTDPCLRELILIRQSYEKIIIAHPYMGNITPQQKQGEG